jgi:hypothetical protein
MRTRVFPFLLLVLLAVSASCSSDDSSGPNDDQDAILGTWHATGFTANGVDFVALGMDLTITLADNGMYTISVTDDQVGVCGDTTTDCENNGAFTYTSSQVTIDAGSADSTTFNYNISGSNMTWTGSIDSTPVTIQMSRVS